MLDPESSPSRAEREYMNRGDPPSPSGSERSVDENDGWYSNSRDCSAQPINYGLNYRGGSSGTAQTSSSNQFEDSYKNYMNSYSMGNNMSSGYGDDDLDNDDIPLLEELGINFSHIYGKTIAVIYPYKRISEEIAEDADLAGPVIFALLLGSCLLLTGKVHFGYIYGFSAFGSVSFNAVLSLLHHRQLTYWTTCSVLGYCLLPVILLAACSIVLSLKGVLGLLLSVAAITWSSYSAVRMLDAKLKLLDQYWLVVYPLVLLYSCFTLITIF